MKRGGDGGRASGWGGKGRFEGERWGGGGDEGG